jgi:hypothetical protein
MAATNLTPNTEEVLELSAVAPKRPKAKVTYNKPNPDDPEGEPFEVEELFELAVPGDFGAAPLRRFAHDVNELDELWGSAKSLSRAQEARMEKLLNKLAASILHDCPAEIIAAIHGIDKRGLVMNFFAGASIRMAQLAGRGLEKVLPPKPTETDSETKTEETE